MRNSFHYHHFPVAHTYTNLICFMELPIQEIMFLLLFIFSQQGRNKRNAIETIAFQLLVQVLFREFLIANQFTECRHDIVESQLMVIHCSGFHMSRPAYNERYPDTTFQTLALQATQFAVTAEEFWIRSPFFVRAVIATENNNRILVQSLLFQFRQNFTYILVQTGNHTGKFGMRMDNRIVTRTFASSPCLVYKKFFLVTLKNGIVGLSKFGMRKCISKESVKRL